MKNPRKRLFLATFLLMGMVLTLTAQKIRMTPGQTLQCGLPIVVDNVGTLRLTPYGVLTAWDWTNKVRWTSGTLVPAGGVIAAKMGTDGEFSLLKMDGTVVWTSDTRIEDIPGAYMEIDLARNYAAIYDIDGYRVKNLPTVPLPDGYSTVSATNLGLKSGQTLLVGDKIEVSGVGYFTLKANGDLQAYDATGALKWRTGGFEGVSLTKPSGMVKMGTDGDLKILNGTTTVWTSNTPGQGWYLEVNMEKGRAAIYSKTGAEILMMPWQYLTAGTVSWEDRSFSPSTAPTYSIGGSEDGMVKSCPDGVFIRSYWGAVEKLQTTSYSKYDPLNGKPAGKITKVAMIRKGEGVLVEEGGSYLCINTTKILDKDGNWNPVNGSYVSRPYTMDASAPDFIMDAAVSQSGRVFLLSKTPAPGGYLIYYNTTTEPLELSLTKWQPLSDLGATRIAADPFGNLWFLNDKKELCRLDATDGTLKKMTVLGPVDDLALDYTGVIFIRRGEYDVYRLRSSGVGGTSTGWYALPRLGFKLSGLSAMYVNSIYEDGEVPYVIQKSNGKIHSCRNYTPRNQLDYGKADLKIISATYDCSTRKFKVSVVNRGDRPSKAGTLFADQGRLTTKCFVGTDKPFPILQPGQGINLYFDLKTDLACDCITRRDLSKTLKTGFTVFFIVDKGNTTDEFDEDNNRFAFYQW